MTDTQTMIRDVCEVLGPWKYIGQTPAGLYAAQLDGKWETFEPHKRYDHCHLLIDWMVEAHIRPEQAWIVDHWRAKFWRKMRCFESSNSDFRIAVLTAARRALKDE